MATFAIKSQPSVFSTIKTTETLDASLLLKILYSDNILQVTEYKHPTSQKEYKFNNEREQIECVLKKMLKPKYQKVITIFSKNAIECMMQDTSKYFEDTLKVHYVYSKVRRMGRVYPADSLGLCQIRRQLRHTLSKENYVDIDIVNCHYELLNQLVNKEYRHLNHFVENRDWFFDSICGAVNKYYELRGTTTHYDHRKSSSDRDMCKNLFVRLLYFGDFDNWCKDYNHPIIKPDWYVDLENEIKEIATKFIADNTSLAEDIEKEKARNLEGSILSWMCQEHERRILEVIYEYLKKKKLIQKGNVVLCFDGLMISCDFDNKDAVLKECELEVQKKLNICIKLKIKPFDEPIDDNLLDFEVPEPPEDFDIMKMKKDEKDDIETVDDHNEAAEIITDRLKDDLIYCKGCWFLKHGNVWTNDRDFIDSYVCEFIMNSKIYKSGRKGTNESFVQYVTNATSIQKAVYNKLKIREPIDIYDKFHTTTKNRLCFKDGVLDFKERKFYLWKDVNFEYYSCVMINRNYGDYYQNPNRAVVNEIKDKIFDTLFSNDIERGIQFLSRGITGNVRDKNFGMFTGSRNNGKGVFYDLMENGFGSYVGSFVLDNVLYQRQGKTFNNGSKDLYWLLDYEFVRLAISQETPDPEKKMIINGALWKKICSGGDEQTARRNYDRVDTKFTIDTTMFIMGNNDVVFDTDDCREQEIPFVSIKQFKTREEIEKMKEDGVPEEIYKVFGIKDDKIKDNCKSIEWANAVVYLLYENFVDRAVPVLFSKDDENTPAPLRVRIIQKYEITRNENDFVWVKSLENDFKDSKTILSKNLLAMGVEKKTCNSRCDLRGKMCYYGLKKIKTEQDEEDEEVAGLAGLAEP